MKTNTLRWLLLAFAALTAISLPGTSFAQKENSELSLYFSVAGFNNELETGVDNRLFLEVRNTGNTSITGIRFSAQGPEGWTVAFNPAEIASLGSGSMQTIDVIVNPGSRASKRGYYITVIADANETRKVDTIWVNVRTSSALWRWVGGIIAAAVIAVFIFIFIRSGKQQLTREKEDL